MCSVAIMEEHALLSITGLRLEALVGEVPLCLGPPINMSLAGGVEPVLYITVHTRGQIQV